MVQKFKSKEAHANTDTPTGSMAAQMPNLCHLLLRKVNQKTKPK
jgi:hypothetical protein